MKFKDWSNIFFLVPVLVGVYYDVIIYAIFVFLVALVSFAYHASKEQKLSKLDLCLALVLISTNVVMVWRQDVSMRASLILALLILMSGVFYVRQWRKGYNMNHGMYHIVASIICLMVIIICK